MSEGRGIRDFIARLRDERGATLVLVALGSVAFIGCAAIAIDVGMLMTAKTQAQRAADSGAHAGAVALAMSSGSEKAARDLAKASALDNEVMGEPVVLQNRDITFPDPDTVRVVVLRNQARNNPVGTLFARILGIDQVDLAVDAMAHVATTTNIEFECLLPVTFQDLWFDTNTGGAPGPNDTFDPDDGDYYVPFDSTGATPTGYNKANNYGDQVLIKTNNAPGTYNPSWWGPWAGQDDVRGANAYRARIRGDRCSNARSPGDWVDTEPGNMSGPTMQGFRDVTNAPGHGDEHWVGPGDPDCEMGCVKDGQGNIVTGSPRIRPIPMFDPRYLPQPGRQEFKLANFASVFVEDVQGNDVYARFLGVVGGSTGGGGEPSGGTDPLFSVIQIIE